MLKLTIIFSVVFVTLSCKNYYNDMIEWSDALPQGISIDSVKNLQPDFIIIDWSKPEKFDTITRFSMTVKNNNDILKMENFLTFSNDTFIARFAHK